MKSTVSSPAMLLDWLLMLWWDMRCLLCPMVPSASTPPSLMRRPYHQEVSPSTVFCLCSGCVHKVGGWHHPYDVIHVTTLLWFQAQQQRVPVDAPCYLDANKQQRQLIAELESKNRLGMNARVMLFTFVLSLAPVFHLEKKYTLRKKRGSHNPYCDLYKTLKYSQWWPQPFLLVYTLVPSLVLPRPETAAVTTGNGTFRVLYLRLFAEKSCRKFSGCGFSMRRRPSLHLTRSSRTPPCWQSYGFSGGVAT